MEASVAAQIITFLNKTSGRDKLYRTCQYGSRLAWWCIQETKRDPILVKKLKGLDSHLSTSRKLLRIGKSVELLRAAQKSVHLSDPFLQFTITFANVNKATYLLVDHLLWLHRVGLVTVDSRYYGHMSSRFWLATLILCLSRDIYSLVDVLTMLLSTDSSQKTASESSPITHQHSNGSVTQTEATDGSARNSNRFRERSRLTFARIAVMLFRHHLALVLDTLKNLADLFLPLTYLGYINLPAGVQGLLGVISSVIGVLTVWSSKFKLVPS
ncbi:peroxisomal membrane protein 11B-like [Diadema antillarum]|uniref:peroxisomal membrane protein 11B-like n=1 Tax=Diadema antillarum TaxID=105358 RepID=UPI003A881972